MRSRPLLRQTTRDSEHTLFNDSVHNLYGSNRLRRGLGQISNALVALRGFGLSDSIEESRRVEPWEDQATLDDERTIKNEAKAFELFERRAHALNSVLDHMCTVALQLDSSHHIISSARHLSKTQDRALNVFERIAKRASGPSPRNTTIQNTNAQDTNTQDMEATVHGTGQSKLSHHEKEEDIYWMFRDWASDIGNFVESIMQLPGHSDRSIAMQMGSHETDLKYWASCLRTYQEVHQVNDPAVQKYIYYLGIETGEHMEKGRMALIHFIEEDMPVILQSQQAVASGFLTVSTLFCAVTATVIQFSYTQHTLLYTFANVAWIFSLGLSTAATIFALLKATWKETILSRWPRLSAHLLVIIERAPLCFLVASIISFFLGLCAFTHAIDQGGTIVVLTTLIASICAIGVIVDLLGFIPKYWRKGRREHEGNETIDKSTNRSRDIEMDGNSKRLSRQSDCYISVPVIRETDITSGILSSAAMRVHSALVRQALRNRKHREGFAKTFRTLTSLSTQTHKLHATAVSHMEFSPDGNFLATCSQDRTCLILDIANLERERRALGICKGHVRQIAWSPHSNYVLTRLQHNIMLWKAPSGPWQMTITRESNVQQVLWLPSREAFLSVEGDRIVEFDIDGTERRSFELGPKPIDVRDSHLFVYSAAVSSDGMYLICIVKLNKSPDGFLPSEDTRKEKQILVYNVNAMKIEYRVPIFHKVRHVSMSMDDFALISYEGAHPPQLWRLIRMWDEETNGLRAHLVLSRNYVLKHGDDISTPPCFGGTADQLVICARKSGDVHIWDRSSAFLLKYIKPLAAGMNNDSPEVLSLARNTKKLMFATGRHDGSVVMWAPASTLEEPEASQRNGQLSAGSSQRS